MACYLVLLAIAFFSRSLTLAFYLSDGPSNKAYDQILYYITLSCVQFPLIPDLNVKCPFSKQR